MKSIVWTKCRTITCISITLVEMRAGLRLINLETRAPKKTLWAFQTSLLFLSIYLPLKCPSLHSAPTGRLRVFLREPALPPRCCPGPAPSSEGLLPSRTPPQLCLQVAHWLPSSPTRCELLGAPRLPHYDPAPGTSKVARVCRVN